MKYLLGLVLLVLAGGAAYVGKEVNSPYQGFTEPVFVEFPRGTATGQMAGVLEAKGVVKSRWVFLAARALYRGKALQAGEYKFEKRASALEVAGRLIKGDIFYLELLIPEGYNRWEAAQAVAKLGTIPQEKFLAAAKDPALIRDLDPKAQTLEGYLFPSKYRLYRHTTAQQLCRMMTGEFRTQWKAAGGLGDPHRAVTLASLVEREARLPQEQVLVASVFANRLRLGMRLGCDPTVVYAAILDGRWRGTIYKSDLASLNPYNTYQHEGLPPGPIANPGKGALRAALAPAETKFLYFVAKADGSGGHNFAESSAKHEANVAVYRRAVKGKT